MLVQAVTGLSRCGRKYQTFEAALLAAELRTSKGAKPLAVVSCAFGSHWHLVPPANVTGNGSGRPDPFPPVVAALLDKRDPYCQLGGGGPECQGRLERHHRRGKASGGSSARAHTQCACNGVRLCRKHHEWVHLNPVKARALGMMVRQSVSKPGSIAMSMLSMILDDPWLPEILYPNCEGSWNVRALGSDL